jgi:hypothetical protein
MLLSSEKYSPAQFRTTLQAFFLFSGIGVVGGHLVSGNIDNKVLMYFLGGLPLVLISFYAGEWLQRKFDPEKFFRWVYSLLALLGLSLILKVIFG